MKFISEQQITHHKCVILAYQIPEFSNKQNYFICSCLKLNEWSLITAPKAEFPVLYNVGNFMYHVEDRAKSHALAGNVPDI